jgi:hypothetical protein
LKPGGGNDVSGSGTTRDLDSWASSWPVTLATRGGWLTGSNGDRDGDCCSFSSRGVPGDFSGSRVGDGKRSALGSSAAPSLCIPGRKEEPSVKLGDASSPERGVLGEGPPL